MKPTETEFTRWAAADARQKSFVVQVLHWFYYRPTRLQASWKQEEVLTWELIRALDLLPQALFLRPLLQRIVQSGGSATAAAQSLLQTQARLAVTAYPSLELRGSKRNCKSDIGLGVEGARPVVWIEAKTASFRAVDLDAQLRQQALAMASLMPELPTALVTLLPQARALATFPNLSWDEVLAVLRSCDQALSVHIPDSDLSHGYRSIARELADRIESHPNRNLGWV